MLDPLWKKDLAAFGTRHPQSASAASAFEAESQRFRDAQLARRKAELLFEQVLRPAAPFDLTTAKGETLSLRDLRGKVVVLNFWATTCGPCIVELGVLQEVYAKRFDADEGVEFVAISTDTNKALVAPFVQKCGWTFPVLLTDGTIEKPYGCETTIPQTYILDKQGNIRFHHEGYLADGFLERLNWMLDAAAQEFEEAPSLDVEPFRPRKVAREQRPNVARQQLPQRELVDAYRQP